MTKELKKDKLYLLDTEYEFEDDEGRQVLCHDKLVGYVLAEDNVFFKGGNLYLPDRQEHLVL